MKCVVFLYGVLARNYFDRLDEPLRPLGVLWEIKKLREYLVVSKTGKDVAPSPVGLTTFLTSSGELAISISVYIIVFRIVRAELAIKSA